MNMCIDEAGLDRNSSRQAYEGYRARFRFAMKQRRIGNPRKYPKLSGVYLFFFFPGSFLMISISFPLLTPLYDQYEPMGHCPFVGEVCQLVHVPFAQCKV